MRPSEQTALYHLQKNSQTDGRGDGKGRGETQRIFETSLYMRWGLERSLLTREVEEGSPPSVKGYSKSRMCKSGWRMS